MGFCWNEQGLSCVVLQLAVCIFQNSIDCAHGLSSATLVHRCFLFNLGDSYFCCTSLLLLQLKTSNRNFRSFRDHTIIAWSSCSNWMAYHALNHVQENPLVLGGRSVKRQNGEQPSILLWLVCNFLWRSLSSNEYDSGDFCNGTCASDRERRLLVHRFYPCFHDC